MTELFICAGIILVAEAVSILLFRWLSRLNKATAEHRKQGINLRSVVKGMLERAFLVFSLLSDLSQALTFFAALKIATRIKDDDRISNDFYLIGNLLSVALAIIYTRLIEYLIL